MRRSAAWSGTAGPRGYGPRHGAGPPLLSPSIPGRVEIQPVIEQGVARGRHPDQEDADLAVVLLAEAAVVLPRDPGALGPLLGEARLVDHADGADRRAGRRGDQLVGEGGLDLGLDVVGLPGGDGDELLQPGDLPGAGAQRDRLDALALGAAHQALEVGVGVVLCLFLAEERGEAPVELDQLLGRGAHVVRSHGGSLLTDGLTNEASADSRVVGIVTRLFYQRFAILPAAVELGVCPGKSLPSLTVGDGDAESSWVGSARSRMAVRPTRSIRRPIIMDSRKTFRAWKPESYAHRPLTPAEILPEDDLVFFLIELVPQLRPGRLLRLLRAGDPGCPAFRCRYDDHLAGV